MSKRKPPEQPRPYTITNVGGQKVEILIYEQIGSDFWSEGITAKQFVHDLAAKGKIRHIDLRINSPGGSFFDGLAIYNTLKSHPAIVDVYIDGIAFSMASVIAMAGDTISMAKNALMMVHNPRGAAAGTPEEIRAYAELMEKARESILTAYEDKTGIDRDELLAMVNAETYMNADEAVEKGFADEVTAELAVAASFSFPSFLNVPENVQAQISSFNHDRRDSMADSAAPNPARVPATIAELKAMAGSTSDFVVAQLEATATADEARAVLCNQLLARAEAAEKKLADLQAAQIKPQAASPAPQSTPPPVTNHGVDPLPSTAAPADPTAKSPYGSDPVAWYRKETQRLIAEGKTAAQACKLIAEEHPDIADAMMA